jgi:hypothetical protein
MLKIIILLHWTTLFRLYLMMDHVENHTYQKKVLYLSKVSQTRFNIWTLRSFYEDQIPPLCMFLSPSLYWYPTYFVQTETARPASFDTSRWSCAAFTGEIVSPQILDVHCCPFPYLQYVFYGILSILKLNLIFIHSSRRWRRRTIKSSMSPRQQYNIICLIYFKQLHIMSTAFTSKFLFYYRLQSWLVQSLCIAFLKGSSENSRDEQGKPISNFSNTVGCKIPRLPILRSCWIFALRCAGGGR